MESGDTLNRNCLFCLESPVDDGVNLVQKSKALSFQDSHLTLIIQLIKIPIMQKSWGDTSPSSWNFPRSQPGTVHELFLPPNLYTNAIPCSSYPTSLSLSLSLNPHSSRECSKWEYWARSFLNTCMFYGNLYDCLERLSYDKARNVKPCNEGSCISILKGYRVACFLE